MKAGSLCAGIGGADLALEALGFDIAWHAEIDPDASAVLAHYWPEVPNLGDITTVDWAGVEPVDVIAAGYPCQPFSLAGSRKGTDDPRHLWPAVRRAVAELRPRYVFLENVRGHLSLGFDTVLADLAHLGFDAQWGVVGSDAIGGCHRRHRLWVVAADAGGPRRREVARGAHGDEAPDARRGTPVDHVAVGAGTQRVRRATSTAPDAGHGGRQGSAQLDLEPPAGLDGVHRQHADRRVLPPTDDQVSLLPTPTSRDHKGANQRNDHTCLHGALLPTPNAADASRGPDLARANRPDSGGMDLVTTTERLMPADSFGDYQTAVDRWSTIAGPPPEPTEPNTKGGRRLHAPFPEWMMGFPGGWVTDHVGRAAALRCIGNAIQPQTALAAWGELLRRLHATEVAA